MPTEARTSIRSSLVSSIACTSATTGAQTTTSSRARASPTQASEASAKRGSPIRMSNRTEESTAIIGSFHRIARGPSADRAHGLVGALEALGQLEPAAHLAQRLADVLAQDDAAAVQFHLEGGALGQAQRVAHGLGQGDLAAFGDGGFHGWPPRTKKYALIIHTYRHVPPFAYRATTLHWRNGAVMAAVVHWLHSSSHGAPTWPTPSPPAPASRSMASPMPTPACRSWANASTSRNSPTR